ncbi:hypothetical protein UY3_07816 [Chelonia mydas]|uniref:Uncharacterized protein n=1 Tax=Chelonia mydas TaxID=8469 RepID=M7BSD0_CHEMY|nr:hypothetical protein UY3_07816 [Chelonia mydas]
MEGMRGQIPLLSWAAGERRLLAGSPALKAEAATNSSAEVRASWYGIATLNSVLLPEELGPQSAAATVQPPSSEGSCAKGFIVLSGLTGLRWEGYDRYRGSNRAVTQAVEDTMKKTGCSSCGMYMVLAGVPEKSFVCMKCRLIELMEEKIQGLEMHVETLVEFRRGFEQMMEQRHEEAEGKSSDLQMEAGPKNSRGYCWKGAVEVGPPSGLERLHGAQPIRERLQAAANPEPAGPI